MVPYGHYTGLNPRLDSQVPVFKPYILVVKRSRLR